jgi:hypothetical protein
MKQLLVAVFTAVCMLFFLESTAQDKKVKDKDKKVKVEGDEAKLKEGDKKVKVDGDEVKVKQGDTKVKLEGDEAKLKMDDLNRAKASTQFVMGNPAHAIKIQELWQDYDDNAFQRHPHYFADNFMATHSDGQVIRGKDTALLIMSQYRSGLTNVKSTIDAVVPLKRTDKNEDLVAIWGTETATDAQGKTTTVAIHELWSFNKDGKVTSIRQYTAQVPKQEF